LPLAFFIQTAKLIISTTLGFVLLTCNISKTIALDAHSRSIPTPSSSPSPPNTTHARWTIVMMMTMMMIYDSQIWKDQKQGLLVSTKTFEFEEKTTSPCFWSFHILNW
jgi:hypothetical protein